MVALVKNCPTVSFQDYTLQSIESFDYTNLSDYGIKPCGYIFDIW